MRRYQEIYLENAKKVVKLLQHAELQGLPGEEVNRRLRERSRMIREMRKENTAILREMLFPLLDDILTAEEEEVQALEEFADRLMRERMDPGIRYYVCNALVTCARVRDLRRLLIKELYMTGMALFEFQSMLEKDETGWLQWKQSLLFGEAAGYIRFYDEIQDVETRGYIHRAMGNMALPLFPADRKSADKKFAVIRRSLQVLTDPVYQEKTPRLPWELYIYKSHQERTSMLSWLRNGTATSRDVREVMESAQYVFEVQRKEAKKTGGRPRLRWFYAYYAASYHCGICTLEELLRNLEKTYALAEHNDYSQDGMYGNLFLPLVYSSYLEKDGELCRRKKPVVLMMYRRQLEYLRCVPKGEDMNTLFYYIRCCLAGYLEYPGENSFREYIKQVMEGRHLETHVHSKMVAETAVLLLRELLRTDAELLLGVRGTKSLKELLERQDELLEFVYEGAKIHDIGKMKMLELYESPSRGRISEEERLHELHSGLGGRILERCSSTKDFVPFAVGHHRWYDGQGGYPESYRREDVQDAVLVDIVSVADFIDQSCNPVGDYQLDVISFEEMLKQLKAYEGSRFSPKVAAAAFRLQDTIREMLAEFM